MCSSGSSAPSTDWPRRRRCRCLCSSRLRRSLSRRSQQIGSGLCNILLRNFRESKVRLADTNGEAGGGCGILVHQVNSADNFNEAADDEAALVDDSESAAHRTAGCPSILSCSGGEFSSSANNCWSGNVRNILQEAYKKLRGSGPHLFDFSKRTAARSVLDLVRDESGIEADEDTWKIPPVPVLPAGASGPVQQATAAALQPDEGEGHSSLCCRTCPQTSLNQFRAVLSRDFTSSDEEDETASGSGEAEDEQANLRVRSLVWESAAVADIKRRLDDTFYARFATVKQRAQLARCQRFDGAESNGGRPRELLTGLAPIHQLRHVKLGEAARISALAADFIRLYGRSGIAYGRNVTDFLAGISMSPGLLSKAAAAGAQLECPSQPSSLMPLAWTRHNASHLVATLLAGIQTPACYDGRLPTSGLRGAPLPGFELGNGFGGVTEAVTETGTVTVLQVQLKLSCSTGLDHVGFGLLFVTLINLCALVRHQLPAVHRRRRLFNLLMAFMTALAVSSLTATALLVLPA
uniref:G_PROTEIN_RECEP_F1_2 domain-containing protein n=1 Tax=Macrostomum lignano TaxID=282301 RepID=A0A1I8FLV8_9PLAT